eukprot:60031_1
MTHRNSFHTNIARSDEFDHLTKSQTLGKLIQSRLSRMHKNMCKKTRKNSDQFFIDYLHHWKNESHFNDKCSVDKRRAVFVSLSGLYRTWRQCPPYILYTALFVLPLKRESLPTEIILTNPKTELTNKEFVSLLKWKNSQGLVLWMLDDYEHPPHVDRMVQPFWYHFNDILTNLYDAVTRTKYKPLTLNVDTWEEQQKESQYGATFVSVMNELYFLQVQYKGVQEIIYASNPESLCPIIGYQQGNHDRLKSSNYFDLYDEFESDEDKENWWISNDYDPYDI